jgi:hypothetical protein
MFWSLKRRINERSKSVRNAFLLMDMMLIEHKSKEIHLQDQFTLREF